MLRERMAVNPRLSNLSGHRSIPWILLGLGLVRNVILLLAYPPAHGADSDIYFLYAEQISGYSAPNVGTVAYPLYAFLIVLTFKILGSAYWLIALQFIMSALIAPLYYLALKRFSPALALAAALVILGDVQLGLMFNFISTEPLYSFLMALTLYTLLARVQISNTAASPGVQSITPLHDEETVPAWKKYLPDAVIGILAVLLLLTRAVGRYLIVPFVVIFWLRTRDWRRTLALVAGFVAAMLVYSLVSRLVIGQVEGLQTGDYMVGTIMFEHPDWVAPENGPASAEWVRITALCDDYYQFLRCVTAEKGSWEASVQLFSATARETILADIPRYVQTTWQKLLDFLSLNGQVFVDPALPSVAQCEGVDQRLSELSDRSFLMTYRGNALEGQPPDVIAEFRQRITAIRTTLCPPLPHSPELRQAVDYVAFRYRSLGRPQPHLWYGALIILTFALPWARRFWPVLLAFGSVLLNHALISALISNIQPRYVVVTNPMRAVLLCLLFYLIIRLGLQVVDWVGRRFSVKS
jgi:hypothetical protein